MVGELVETVDYDNLATIPEINEKNKTLSRKESNTQEEEKV